MAEPLRRVSGEPYAVPQRQPQRRTTRNVDLAPKRLVSRQIQSNALYRRTLAWLFLGMFVILFALGFTYTFVKAGVSRLNYQMHSVQAENDLILLENAKIKGQIAELRSLERIEAIAMEELGMVKNEAVDYMVLSSDIVVEGKIKQDDNETKAEQGKTDPLDKALRFLAERLFR